MTDRSPDLETARRLLREHLGSWAKEEAGAVLHRIKREVPPRSRRAVLHAFHTWSRSKAQSPAVSPPSEPES